ncbi:MAG: SpoIID/LytB domain-containing protein [Peptococcaceae bacterium]|nr:SpoIID/LytB domain-containing protein [Peptococcaceae bacterium]
MGRDKGLNLLRAACLFLLMLLVSALPYRAGAQVAVVPNTIRVGLAQDVQSQDFYVQGRYCLVDQQSGEKVADVLPGERWQVRFIGGGMQLFKNGQQVGTYGSSLGLQQVRAMVAVLGGSGALKNVATGENLAVTAAGGRVLPLQIDSGGINVISVSGIKTVQGGGDLNLAALVIDGRAQTYRGNMEFRIRAGGVTVINELPLEEYLYGVVPREMPASWPEEALKAQAVAARSYALANLGTYRDLGFDLLAVQLNQVYGGYSAEHANTNRAVDETRGEVLSCRGKTISAFFHSSSGGYVESSSDVWREDLDYLKAKPDPYDKNDKYYDWMEVYTGDQLVNRLFERKSLYNKSEEPERFFTSIDDIEILEKTSSGARVKRIRITGTGNDGKPMQAEISNADGVRVALGLKSALFEMKKEKDNQGKLVKVTFKGSGYGHGLGLSQYGALGMTNKGYNYQDILKYYYNNTEVRSLS